jgi:hypothetical protein
MPVLMVLIRGEIEPAEIAPRSTIDFDKAMMTAEEGQCQY